MVFKMLFFIQSTLRQEGGGEATLLPSMSLARPRDREGVHHPQQQQQQQQWQRSQDPSPSPASRPGLMTPPTPPLHRNFW